MDTPGIPSGARYVVGHVNFKGMQYVVRDTRDRSGTDDDGRAVYRAVYMSRSLPGVERKARAYNAGTETPK